MITKGFACCTDIFVAELHQEFFIALNILGQHVCIPGEASHAR